MTSFNRVTQHTVAARSLAGLQGNLNRVGQLQNQLSTGKAINRPSDSPAGTSSALQFRAEVKRNTQWSRNADNGLSWLGQLNNTLMGASTSATKVRDLTLQGMNTGALDQTSRQALAAEVDQLRADLLTQANTKILGRPVFGGTIDGPKAYDDAGNYVGDSQPISRTIGGNASVRVDLSGPEAFGPAGADLFTTLANISNDLRTNPANLGNDLTALDGQLVTMRNALSDVGARVNRLEKAKQAADDRAMDATNSLNNVESIDLPDTIMKLEMANVGYQAALGATAKAIQPSLMDFLR